jgi:transketolase
MGELDRRAIDTVRVLAMDAVQKAGNGHPGTAMSVGPTAYLLFQKSLRRPRARHGRHHERHHAA